MNRSAPQYFYLFKGNWFDRFDELTTIAQKNEGQSFELWEPNDKTRKVNLLIVSGKPLSETYCLVKKVFQTDEDIFLYFFQPFINDYHIHKLDISTEEQIKDSEENEISEYVAK